MDSTARSASLQRPAGQTANQTANQTIGEQALADALSAVKAEIAGDAASAPAEYLRDSIVPEGGE